MRQAMRWWMLLPLLAAPGLMGFLVEGQGRLPIQMPRDCRVIDRETEVVRGWGQGFRVRSSGRFRSSGNRQTILVEAGGRLDYTGDTSRIYIDDGASASIRGDGNHVFLVGRARLEAFGSNNVARVSAFDVSYVRGHEGCR